MKTLDEKAVDYTNRICNQTGSYSRGELETAYVTGAIDSKELQPGECGTFGQAIEALKHDKLVTRKGWNGKGMFIFMRPSDSLHIDTVVNVVKSLPIGVKNYFKQDILDQNGNPIESDPGDKVLFTRYLCMKAADGTIVNGCLASQTDMLAEDWMIFEY